MPHYKYLIIGAGMTADAAVHGIRQVDADGSIGLIGAETDPPYSRPPLSKGLWKNQKFKNIWLKNSIKEASIHLGRRIQNIDPKNNSATDEQGVEYGFEKLLLATGGTPRRTAFDSPGVTYFRTVGDYQHLHLLVEEKQRFAVIGGGFIGSEIAAALTISGKDVVMIFPGQGIGDRLFPTDLSQFLNDYYRQKGVDVRSGEEVISIETCGWGGSSTATPTARSTAAPTVRNNYLIKTQQIQTKKQQEIAVDAVVAGIGIEPNVELARQAGLEVTNGIRVDAALKTNRPNIFAAGDVAEFFNPALGKYLRVEHEDNANTMGDAAGRSMAGQAVSYDHLPFFYSDLFELGYEAVGEVDPRLDTMADWKEPFREGIVYYLHEGRVRGALLWNVWGQVDDARKWIAEGRQMR